MKVVSSRHGNALMDFIMTLLVACRMSDIVTIKIEGNEVIIEESNEKMKSHWYEFKKEEGREEIQKRLINGKKSGEVERDNIPAFIQTVIQSAFLFFVVERPLQMIKSEYRGQYIKILKGMIKGIGKGHEDLRDLIYWVQDYLMDIIGDKETPSNIRDWLRDEHNNLYAIKPRDAYDISVDRAALVRALERGKIR